MAGLLPVTGLLLAGGLSRRFGADKRAAPVAGRPMLEASIARWLAALPGPGRLTVVLRHDDDEALVARVQALGARALRAAGSGRGLGASLAAGAAAQPPGVGLLVGLADMPFVRSDTIARVAARVAAGSALVAPFHEGRRGHPVGFGPAWQSRLAALDGDRGAAPLLAGAGFERLEVDDPGVLEDVDLPAQLAQHPAG